MSDTILVDKELSNAVCSYVINAPVEKIDIAAWLLKLSEGEYRRCCPPDHVSCGSTLTDEGKPMLVNVEMVGHALMVQRYVAEIATPTLCRLVSFSDAFTPNGRTHVQVVWTLTAKQVDENTCEFVNRTTVHPTEEFMDFIAQHKIRFKDAAAARQIHRSSIFSRMRLAFSPVSAMAHSRAGHGLSPIVKLPCCRDCR